MTNLVNNIQNNALAALTNRAPSGVVNAIKQASTKTGVNFAYLVQQASAESSFDADAKARTSSASGLYQFIERTWLDMVERHGDKHGIDTSGKTRGEILELRNDPKAASLMAAEFASENEKFLDAHYGGEIGATELYFAHFLGAGGASSFLNARQEDPMQKGAILFPSAAKANRNVFYDQSSGRAKSLDEIYAYFDKKFSIENTPPASLEEDTTSAAIANANETLRPDPEQKPNFKSLNASLYTFLNSKDGSAQINREPNHGNSLRDLSASFVRRIPENPLGMFKLSNPGQITALAAVDPSISQYGGAYGDLNLAQIQRTNSLYSALRSYKN